MFKKKNEMKNYIDDLMDQLNDNEQKKIKDQ